MWAKFWPMGNRVSELSIKFQQIVWEGGTSSRWIAYLCTTFDNKLMEYYFILSGKKILLEDDERNPAKWSRTSNIRRTTQTLYAGVEISEFLGCDEKLEKIFILIWFCLHQTFLIWVNYYSVSFLLFPPTLAVPIFALTKAIYKNRALQISVHTE